MKKKRIAIIGGGCAGVAAAWSLKDLHDITLFERDSRLGGHALTEKRKVDGQDVDIDLGVELFTEKLSPNLFEILNHFDIDSYVAPLSFGAYFEDGAEHFWCNHDKSSKLWQSLRKECERFHLDMHNCMHKDASKVKTYTLGKYLAEKNYTDDFTYKALLPLMTTFSGCNGRILENSLTYCALAFNLGLLSFFAPTYWRKVKGGIATYIERIALELGDSVVLNAAIDRVVHTKSGINVIMKDAAINSFDQVIFATNADIALSLIQDPTDLETSLLGAFEYYKCDSVYHSDLSVLKSHNLDDPYCQYTEGASTNKQNFYGSMTRINNKLNRYKEVTTPQLVTIDPKSEIDEKMTYMKKAWRLPLLKPKNIGTKTQLRKIQGKRGLWFCGTDTTFSGHEGSILSGFVIAQALGAPYKFSHNQWALIQLNVVKGLMGVHSTKNKVELWIAKLIHKVAKLLKLQKGQISRAVLDVYGV